MSLPDHRRRDLDPAILGAVVEMAGLTGAQFRRLTGAGHRRYAREIRWQVYAMEE